MTNIKAGTDSAEIETWVRQSQSTRLDYRQAYCTGMINQDKPWYGSGTATLAFDRAPMFVF